MAGYVFLSNSSKPSEEKRRSRENVKISSVSRPCIEAALDLGYEVTLGTNRHKPEELSCEFPIKFYDSHTYRSITAFGDNKIAYDNLCKVLDQGDVEVIHCNTPVGGLVGRLAGKRKKIKKIIYTAHGFHFYKGAPLINRTVYKWAEQIMAHWTDVIITMNKEDFEAAKKFKLRKKRKSLPGTRRRRRPRSLQRRQDRKKRKARGNRTKGRRRCRNFYGRSDQTKKLRHRHSCHRRNKK